MGDWLETIFAWLPEGRVYYALLGTLALLESVVGVGILVPGSLIIVFAGFLAFHGQGDFAPLAISVMTGAFLGDVLSYALGARLGDALVQGAPFRRHHQVLHKATIFFADHGGKSVFFGRFIGPLRGFIPFVAGYAKMGPGFFLLYTALSSLLWGAVYPGLGFLGGASWEKVRLLTGRFGMLMVVLLVLLVLNGLFWKKAAPPLGRRLAKLWACLLEAWGRFLRRPAMAAFIARHPTLWTFLAKRFSLHSGTGLYLTLGFVVSALFAAAFVWLAADLPPLRSLDQKVYLMFGEIRHPAADRLMIAAAALADGSALLLVGGYVLLWLILHNRDFSALVLVVGIGGGELLVFLLNLLVHRPIPAPFLPDLQEILAGFPSGHAFSTYLLCGLTTYFILGTYTQWQSRLTVVIAGSSLILLVGFSRIYLGIQWVSSVLAGYALAALWLTFLITASEMRRRYAGEFPWRAGWEPLQLSPAARKFILSLTGLFVAGALASHLLHQLGIL